MRDLKIAWTAPILALAALGLGLTGCSSKGAAATAAAVIPVPAPMATAAPAAHDSQMAAQCPVTASPQPTMDVNATMPLTAQPKLDAGIARLERQHGSNKALATLYAERGAARMMDPQAAPHLKYPAALSDFRKAVHLDPSNRAAAGNAQLIEEIYRGLGKAVPAG